MLPLQVGINVSHGSLTSVGQEVLRSLLFHLVNNSFGYTGEGKSSIMEKVLHGHHPGHIGEHQCAIPGTIFCDCIAQWTHFFGID